MNVPETVDKTFLVPLKMTLFGPIQVLVQGQPLPHLRSRKALWLLALLTLKQDNPVERDWLARTLWPDMDQSQAFANLRPVVSELRRALGDAGDRLQSPSRHTLHLDLNGSEADVLIFDNAMKSQNPLAWEQAISLYRGPLLEGCTEEWVGQERMDREQRCLQSLQKLADTALSSQEYEQAIHHYRRAVAIAPLWDTAHRGLMETYSQNSDIITALQVYRDFANLLKADLKALPDEKTTALYLRLRQQGRQQPLPLHPSSEELPPSSIGALPQFPTKLIGREDEHQEVITRLKRARLVTLTGLGGIGKTRLAVAVASELRREYPDSIWFISLASLSSDTQLLSKFASVLGIEEETDRSLLQVLTDHLKKKRLLLIVDNCEHLLDGSARLLRHLLQECLWIRILATSREAMSITGEMTWTVPSLAVPDPKTLPTGLTTLQRVSLGYESILLFIERAQALENSFTLTGANALTIAQICWQLEGIPLAIELAAAQIDTLTVEEIGAQLKDRLSLLTGGNRTALSRQQTLRTTLDWSLSLLSEPERLLFCRLSVLVGGWDLETATAACSGDELTPDTIPDLLTSLVDKSLILPEEHEGTTDRYRFLETIRQYAVTHKRIQ